MGAAMRWLYHECPRPMIGATLYPLALLRDRHPDLHARARAKYGDHPSRADLPRRAIPKLDARWDEVVHCAPIAPHLLYRALAARGLRPDPARAFFRIPLAAIAGAPTVAYTGSGRGPGAPLRDEDIAWLDRSRYAELDAVPAATLAWYDRLAREGRIRGVMVGVPHILVRGAIEVGNAELVRWGEPTAAS